MSDDDTATYLLTLFAETRALEWSVLAALPAPRLHHCLAARFDYDVRQGGYAQLIYNMKGNLLGQMEDMLIETRATVAHEYYVRAIKACLTDKLAYRNFMGSDFVSDNPLKDILHSISIEYLGKGISFSDEAQRYLIATRNQAR